MRLIADGEVERSGVPGLAARLGYSERQLHRLLVGELGVGPLALARAQRAQTARLLIETTDLPMADVAFAAGFASIRQFNDTVREVFATTPSALRRTEPGPDRRVARLAHPPARRPGAVRRRRGAALPGRARGAGPRGVGRDDVLPRARPAARPRDRAALPRCRRRRRRSPPGCGWPSCATSAPPSPAAAGCSTWTPTRPPSTTSSAPTPPSPRWCGSARARASRPRPTPTSWRCAQCSASRCRWPAPAPSPRAC